MAKRTIFVILTLVAVVSVGALAYSRYQADRRLNGGEVLVVETGRNADAGATPALAPMRSEASDTSGTRATTTQITAPAPVRSEEPVRQQFMAPVADSIAPNPPNGMAFAGSGRFQVYRQGDLTWRLNTDTGNTCVLFATLEQWQKPLVYRNGCSEN